MNAVRECTYEDLFWLTQMTERFNNKYYDVPINTRKAGEYLYNMLLNGNSVMLRTDNAAIIGIAVDDPFRDYKALVEIGWYSEGKDGIRLLDTFEDYGRDLRVDEIRMTTLQSNPGVERLLLRRGYNVMETSHRLTI